MTDKLHISALIHVKEQTIHFKKNLKLHCAERFDPIFFYSRKKYITAFKMTYFKSYLKGTHKDYPHRHLFLSMYLTHAH